jgi:hypothetical protein
MQPPRLKGLYKVGTEVLGREMIFKNTNLRRGWRRHDSRSPLRKSA